jgi:hypothetical protein
MRWTSMDEEGFRQSHSVVAIVSFNAAPSSSSRADAGLPPARKPYPLGEEVVRAGCPRRMPARVCHAPAMVAALMEISILTEMERKGLSCMPE